MSSSIPYAVDLAICVDCGADMEPLLQTLRTRLELLLDLLPDAFRRKEKYLQVLRARMIMFSDVDLPIVATPFFVLPDESEALRESIGTLAARGTHGNARSGLDALALAIRSDWTGSLPRRRHIVVVLTGGAADPLGVRSKPNDADRQSPPFPTSLEELSAVWGDEDDDGDMEYAAKRLIVFAPPVYPWKDIIGLFENSMWIETGEIAAEAGWNVLDLLDAVAGSV